MRDRARPVWMAVIALGTVAISLGLALRRPERASTARFAGSRTVIPLRSLLPSPALPSRVRVAIVRDAAAAGYYGRAGTLDTLVRAWRDVVRATGADVIIVRSALSPAARAARVLVVPSSPCVSIATHEAIDAAKRSGQGLLVGGHFATHDAGCRPLGYGAVVGLTSASRVDTLDTRPMVYVTVPAGGPLAVGIPPGARLGLGPARQLALRVPGRDAFYSDYSLRPAPAAGARLLDGAIARGTHGRARVVYWGFEPHEVERTPWNRAIAGLLARNSVAWAAGVPVAAPEPWPAGRRSAAVIAQDVEDRFGNARHALDSLRAAHVRSTFYLTSDLARKHTALARSLAESGEIGTHSENHRRLGGSPPAEQRRRLVRTQRDLAALLGRPVAGLRPPQEQFDTATMSAWAAAGGTHLFGANDSRAAAPELFRAGADTIVMLGRVTADDFAAMPGTPGQPPDSLAEIYLEGHRRIAALGGLYILSYHSQLLARAEFVPALARVARAIAADSAVWLATAGDVAGWWRSRAGLEVRVRRDDPWLRLTVRNRADASVGDALVAVTLPPSRRVRSVTGARLAGMTDGVARLELPRLAPGATRDIVVRTTGASSTGRRSTVLAP